MMGRSILAATLGSALALALATDVAQSEDQAMTAACPGPIARITLNDYEGSHLLLLCVAARGLGITHGVVSLNVYDNTSDGLFHNGFEIGQ